MAINVSGTPTRSGHCIVACSHVRLLGVHISCDRSLHHHVSRICAGYYYRLRQLRRLRRSLNSDSLAIVCAVVKSRIDYCNTVLAGAPRTVTDKLQHALKYAAARVFTGTWKFDRGLGQTLHAELHKLDRRPRPDVFQAGSDCLTGV